MVNNKNITQSDNKYEKENIKKLYEISKKINKFLMTK